MNKLVVLLLLTLATILSLLSTQNLANAEIKLTAPPNWQPAPNNNSTSMIWYQNSTKSVFGINKAPDILSFPLFLTGPFVAQFLTDKGVLESSDQISFGQRNYGYRYLLTQIGSFLTAIPEGYNVPYKGMLILSEKQDGLYAIVFLSPKENFDSVLNEIKPSLDSIQLSNSTE